MEVFNEPSPENSCEARETPIVTPQVFSLFNSEASLDRAVALARRAQSESRGPRATLDRVFLLVHGRLPSAGERSVCMDHWQAMTERHRRATVVRREFPTEAVREAVEENTGERFTFVEDLEFYRDFVPDLQMADVDPETRGLAEVCLVLFNANEFAFVY
jgi:hypothetical protein